MNQITKLSENIASLQKVHFALNELEGKHWRDTAVWNVALTVRNSFNKFDQKWRDFVKGNPFFYFCIPVGGYFLDAGGVFHHNPLESDETTQQHLLDGCEQLNNQIPKLIAQMQSRRNNLLSLQNQNNNIAAFQEFDTLNQKLSQIFLSDKEDSTSSDIHLQDWLVQLLSVLKAHGFDKRFNPSFDDHKKTLAERIESREVALHHIVDSLATNPAEHLPKGGQTVTNNFGDNTVIGVQNNGTAGNIEKIAVHAKQLQKNYPSISENIERITAEIAEIEMEPETKQKALYSLSTVSEELAKPAEQQQGWMVKESLDRLTKIIESAASLGGAAVKLEPYVTKLIQSIHQYFPNIPLS